jgi:hypothetical protein
VSYIALLNFSPQSLIDSSLMVWDSGITGMSFSFYQVRGLIRSCHQTSLVLMGFVPVVATGMVNVLLFCATHRIPPAQSVVPGWWSLFRLSGFTESNPSQDTDKYFACRGAERSGGRKDLEKGCLEEDEEPMSPRPQLDLLDDPHGPRVRIKIDNHIDNTLQSGENRDSMSDADRSIAPNSQLAASPRSG